MYPHLRTLTRENAMTTTKLLVVAATALTLGGLFAGPAGAQDDEKVAKNRGEIDAHAEEALKEFFATVEGGQALFDKAAGYATFRVTKAGFGVSGQGGQGVAVDKASGSRVYMNTGGAGAGLTFGANRYDIVILFESADRFAKFKTGGWDSDATASAAAGSSGADVGASFFEGVAYFQIGNRGLMASADVTGTRFWVSEDLN
jgi:lipid-binding SYLF domain-containing protein